MLVSASVDAAHEVTLQDWVLRPSVSPSPPENSIHLNIIHLLQSATTRADYKAHARPNRACDQRLRVRVERKGDDDTAW